MLALLRVSHDVIDKGISTGLVEGHLDESALRDHCRGLVARYKVPQRFFAMDELAGDQLGKLRRRDVQRDLLALLSQG